MKRSTRLAPIGKRRRGDGYVTLKRQYLTEHPFCQATIARLGLDESEVLKAWLRKGYGPVFVFAYKGQTIPAAVDIHHRNKSNGPRRCDVHFFLSVARNVHDQIEDNKAWARAEGLLLPINADPEGNLPNGTRGLTTPEFMASKVGIGFVS